MTPATERPSILIIDDTEANLVALEALLGDFECELVRARSGNEALRQLLKRDFALLLLDVHMPDMDGFEVARHARAHERSRDVPIIFITAARHAEDAIMRGYGSGAVDFLHKPVVPAVLRGKVRVFLELHEARQRLARTLRELDLARIAAERANDFKSKFLADMSHELRTPLNTIIGFAELLEDEQVAGPLSAIQREYIGYMVASGKHLVGLMNDILDLSRIEAGRVELHKERLPTAAVLSDAAQGVYAIAVRRGVLLQCDLPDGLPDVCVDPLRMKQILFNLLSNGIKFTPRGGQVRLSAAATDAQIEIAVADTGVGIHADDLARLFREFERLAPQEGTETEGTGLGLALTRRLVELHGGRIEVESAPGRGSTFTVVLPLA